MHRVRDARRDAAVQDQLDSAAGAHDPLRGGQVADAPECQRHQLLARAAPERSCSATLLAHAAQTPLPPGQGLLVYCLMYVMLPDGFV